jgi:hypothetical protein|tara:strand:- start:199 stop:519 length:321 start_codon:yes stop_codon:yes gene_type:complete
LSRETQQKKSFILSLKKEGRVNEGFLNIVSDLTLEELIAVKLEQSSKMMRGKLYNFPLWYTMPNVCRDACMLFVRTCCSTKADMASVLGVPYDYFIDLYKKYYKEY